MTTRRAIREELLHVLSADKEGNPTNLPDPPPPLEESSNRLFELLSRACHVPLAATKISEDSRTVYELLPLFLLRILGYRPGSGWLETAADLPHRDREALLRLVMPNGPIHNFCLEHEPSNPHYSGSSSVNSNFTYEFPVSNLPLITSNALNSPDYAKSGSLHQQSALAHLLRRSQNDMNKSILNVTPLQYFELCMVSSASKKWTDTPRLTSKSRRQKRSSSLPSIRALYNKVISAYAELLSVNTLLESTQSLLIPACIDMFCLPWAATSVFTGGPPRPSTPSVDALSSVLLVLTPKSESEAAEKAKQKSLITWTELTHGEAIYKGTGIVLEAVFSGYDKKEIISTFAAFVRLFALYITPWKRSIRLTMHSGLFPKKRSNASSGTRSFKSTLNSINEQIKYASGVSPQKTELISYETMKKWRENMYGYEKQANCVLILLLVIRAANNRLAESGDGCRALALVAEAAISAGLKYDERQGQGESAGKEKLEYRIEEARGCLVALKEQIVEAEARLKAKTKPFVPALANCLGIHMENNGSLFNIDMSRMTEKLRAVSTNSGSKTGGETSRLVQRRRTTMHPQSLHERVEFIGSVWEKPITADENELLVTGAYWLSLRLEPYFGYVPNTRLLGRPSTWLLLAVGCLFITSVSMLIRMIF